MCKLLTQHYRQKYKRYYPLWKTQKSPKNVWGFFKGGMVMSDDFDDYLGDDFWFLDDELIKEIEKYHYYEVLPIAQTHILNLQTLEFHHKDPFNRMIISQAMCEHLTALTVSGEIAKYLIEFIS